MIIRPSAVIANAVPPSALPSTSATRNATARRIAIVDRRHVHLRKRRRAVAQSRHLLRTSARAVADPCDASAAMARSESLAWLRRAIAAVSEIPCSCWRRRSVVESKPASMRRISATSAADAREPTQYDPISPSASTASAAYP